MIGARYGDLRAYAKAVHNIEIEQYQESWEQALDSFDRTIIVCPPDTYKTTTVRMWCEQKIGLNPNIRILWLQNAGDQAQKQVMTVQRTIDSNNIYRAAFSVEADPDAQWTKSVLFVRRDYTGAEPTLMGCGLNGPYQGLHFDIIIIDDPTNQEDVRSPTAMELQTSKLRGVIVDRLVEGGRIVGILTRWGEADLVPTFADMGFTIIEMPIAGDYPWGPTLSPKRFPPERIELIRRDKGDMLFALTFMCSTSGVSGNVIKREHIGYWDASTMPNQPLHWYLAIDPAASTKTTADYCLGPDTRILYPDFIWRRLSEVSIGDCVLAPEEYPEDGRRKLRKALVTGKAELVQPCYRIVFEDGRSVVSSQLHRWLVKGMFDKSGTGFHPEWGGGQLCWMPTFDLKPGYQLRQLSSMAWEEDRSYEAGWLAGFLDGEGWVQSAHGRLGFAQKDGEVADYALSVLKSRGYSVAEHQSRPDGLRLFQITSRQQAMRLLGTIRPKRLLAKAVDLVEGRELPYGRNGHAEGFGTIAAVEYIGNQEVVGLETSESTFIAEGLASHNSAIAIVGTDLKSRTLYLADMWARRVETPDLEVEVVRRCKRVNGLKGVGLETMGFQLSLLQYWKRKHNLPFKEIPYRSSREANKRTVALDRDKVGRAAYLDSLFASGRLLLPRGLPLVDGVSLETELCLVPYGKHDDRMDALAMACVLAEGARKPFQRHIRSLYGGY